MRSKAFLILCLCGLALKAQASPLYVVTDKEVGVAVVDPYYFKLAGYIVQLPEGLSATAQHSENPELRSGNQIYSAQNSDGHGLVRCVDLASNSTTASMEIPGSPILAACLANSVFIASESGVLYKLNRALSGTAQTLILDGTPKAFYWLPEAEPSPVPSATPSPNPSPSPTPGQPSPLAPLRGTISGRLLDPLTHEALQGLSGTAQALNRRGKSYDGSIDASGNWKVENLPWGAYEIIVEAQGYHKLVHLRALLTGAKEENPDLELSKE